ncbi:hypothetical protein AOQ84DRAFT_97015 [Glonium stellatum]|uniref:SH3 domain-containing protein n=1 Tax=Glonium stellatum TaxID=574774 RepID=A0A8E2JYB7_9PEZI|nr:hypothetical protein AOQ84DRAFT_97015 [Glonium stellatum]
MTRPQIIRADTLDLQDKTSPTAQDHSRQPAHPSPLGVGPAAPHQAAAVRHVSEERSAEESNLSRAWSDANTLREDPGSDDEKTIVDSINGDNSLQQDEQAVRLNGGISGTGDDGDMADAEIEDLDDDMDKISSSPSIDDGGYFLPSTWPKRNSSLTPVCTPIRSPDNSLLTNSDSSSPFTSTPLYFPLSAAAGVQNASPAAEADPMSTFFYITPSIHFPFQSRPQEHPVQSEDHHRNSEYISPKELAEPDVIGICDDSKDLQENPNLIVIESRLRNWHQDSQISLLESEFDEEDLYNLLLPVNDPLLDNSLDNHLQEPEAMKRSDSPVGSSSSWTTDSDADSAGDEENCNDDESKDFSFSDDSRFIDSGWGGECLRETEDIDFEFVYALHTFVATVEGQANATKGDTMVLLDDSNSYWWLVRVAKDNSIGYLPAEHIETPTERLARLNKHRNIDLSATMLGDTAEKSKNPLKKAMRRRNAKTVQFAAPTYVEASDYDYSSDEENGDDEIFGNGDSHQREDSQDGSEQDQDEIMAVEPLKINGAKKEAKSAAADAEPRESSEENSITSDKQRTSDEMFDRPHPKVSRNGTLRNTDSFFKDDNVETRKITLTPNLLRDDSSGSTMRSFDGKERGPSLESLEKNGFADKAKEDKKKKEKKPGMLSGLFKRKDKKPKSNQDAENSDAEKQSEELGRGSPQSKGSDDSPTERSMSEKDASTQPQRQTSKGKLQKPPPGGDVSPSKNRQVMPETESPEPTTQQNLAPPNSKPNDQQNTSTMRLVPPESEAAPEEISRNQSPEQNPEQRSRSNSSASRLTNMLGRAPSETRPEKVKKAKQRVQLDDFDSSPDEEKSADPFADPADEQEESFRNRGDSDAAERLSESPVQISPTDAQPPEDELSQDQDQGPDPHQPPGLTGDTSSQDSHSPVSTPSPRESPSADLPSAPNLIASRPAGSPSPTTLTPSPAPPTRPAPIPTHEMSHSPPPSSTTSLPAWSDASLRSYLDDGSDIRDMLLVVHDTSGVVPVGPDHPIMAGLFVEERGVVKELGGQLDSLLGEWLERKRARQLGKVGR